MNSQPHQPYPLVSIVVPTYNQARYLPVALDGILFQDYPRIEVIVVNDGSQDETSRVLSDYLAAVSNEDASFLLRMEDGPRGSEPLTRRFHKRFPQDRRIVVVDRQENIGATGSYNQGMERTTGTYCTFVVSDDIIHPGSISEMVRTIEREGADFVYSDLFVVDDAGRILRKISPPDYSFEACFADWYRIGNSHLYRRELIDRVGLFDPAYRLANDYDLYLRFAMAGAKFLHIPKVLYSKRHHGPDRKVGQWSPSSTERLIEESRECARRARRFLESRIHEPEVENP